MSREQASPRHRLEDLVDPDGLDIPDTPGAQRTKRAIERHFDAEWVGDLDAIMATMDPTDPFQWVPSLGLEARGADAVRTFYQDRIDQWPGQAFKIDRAIVGEHGAAFEGYFTVQPNDNFLGLPASGSRIRAPGSIWIHTRGDLLWGEILYFDADDVRRQLLETPSTENPSR